MTTVEQEIITQGQALARAALEQIGIQRMLEPIVAEFRATVQAALGRPAL